MSQIKKFAWHGVAVVAAFVAMTMMVSTANAAVTALTANPASITVGQTSTITATVAANGTVLFEVLPTSTTSGAIFLANGATALQCTEGDACDIDGGAGDGVISVRLFVPSTSGAGTVNIRATDLADNDTETVSVTVTGAVGSLASIEVTGPASIMNGGTADVTVVGKDSAGNRLAINDLSVTVQRANANQVGNDCAPLGAGGSAFTDNNCLIDIVTSTVAPAKVGVQETTGSVGETVVVTAFDTSGPVPIVGQHTMIIAGGAASAAIDAPDQVSVGGTADITITVEDANGNPVAPTNVTVQASEGVIVCPTTPAVTSNGTVTCTFVAPGSAQSVVITAVVQSVPQIVVTETVQVGAAPPAGAADLNPTPAASGITLTVVQADATIEAIVAAAGNPISIWITVGGQFVGYIPGAPAFVNAAFLAQTGGSIDGGTAIIVVK